MRLWNSEELDVELSSSFIELGHQSKTLLSIFRDIAERKQLERALRESSQFNQQIVASAQEGIVVYDRDLKYRVWNLFMEQLTGLPARQMLGKHPANVLPFVQEAGILTSIKHALAGKPARSLECHFDLPQTGKSGWMFQADAPLRNPAGEIIGVIGIVRDITERKRAELRVAAFSQLGQSLSTAQTAREAAEIIVEAADHLLGWDACTLDLYSAEKDQLLHVLNQDTINGQREDVPTVYHDEPPSPRMRRTVEGEGQLILREGPPALSPDARPFGDTARPSASMMFVPVRDGSRVIGVFSIHSYTPKAYDPQSLETLQALADHCAGALKRISAQEALVASEANYRSLVERSPDAILLHREGKFVYANPAGLKLLRAAQPQQILGRPVFDIVPPENRDFIRERIQQASEGGRPPLLEQQIVRLDGTTIEAEAASIPLTYEGQPAVQTIMRDITERKNSERRVAAFSNLGQKLSGAKTAREAGDIIVEVADQLLGWDGCTLDLYSSESDRTFNVLTQDIINGQRVDCAPVGHDAPPSPRARRAIETGALLILVKDDPASVSPDAVPFGDTARPSACSMFVPIRDGAMVIGVLSIHSFTPGPMTSTAWTPCKPWPTIAAVRWIASGHRGGPAAGTDLDARPDGEPPGARVLQGHRQPFSPHQSGHGQVVWLERPGAGRRQIRCGFLLRGTRAPSLGQRAGDPPHRPTVAAHRRKGNLAQRHRELGVDHPNCPCGMARAASSAPVASPATSPSASGRKSCALRPFPIGPEAQRRADGQGRRPDHCRGGRRTLGWARARATQLPSGEPDDQRAERRHH